VAKRNYYSLFYSACRTKQVTRFHPTYVLEAVKLLAQHNEQLQISAKAAWEDFLV